MLLNFVGRGSPISPLTYSEDVDFKKKMQEGVAMDEKARAKAERLETMRQKVKAMARMQRIFANLR